MSLYAGKVICGPMVRISNLGFRSFAEAHGADVIFTEEIVAVKLQKCVRTTRYYEEIGKEVVEYIAFEPFKKKWKRTIVFSTYARSEKEKEDSEEHTPSRPPLILQLGVSDKESGAAAALLCCEDVDGFDINMGCPKKFSVENGMGASLMTDPLRAASIIAHIYDSINAPELVRARNGRVVPISMKTRVMSNPQLTLKFLVDIISRVSNASTEERTATPRIHAITLHARTRDQLSETPPLYDVAAATVQLARKEQPALFQNVCFVFNGSVYDRADGLAQMKRLGFDGVMLARYAMWNPTVFTPLASSSDSPAGEPSEPLFTSPSSTLERQLDVYRGLADCYVRHRTPFLYVKYHLTRSFPSFPASKHLMPRLQLAKNYSDLARIFKCTPEVVESYANKTWEEYATEEEIERWHLDQSPNATGARSSEEANGALAQEEDEEKSHSKYRKTEDHTRTEH